jgi:hypothetical protein
MWPKPSWKRSKRRALRTPIFPFFFLISKVLGTSSMKRTLRHQKAPSLLQEAAERLGGVLGWLAVIGSFAIPGVGPFVAAGPLMAALRGAAIGSAVGGLMGVLVGMGIPEYEAKRYEAKLRDGNILISIHSENSAETDRAEKVLERSNAHDISSTPDVALNEVRIHFPILASPNRARLLRLV